METYFSSVDKKLVCHMVWRKEDFKPGRQEIVTPDNYIQCAALHMEKGKTFRPHKHNYHDTQEVRKIAQESWVVLQGRVKVMLYDIDSKLMATSILKPGDASFTLHGGHNYQVLEHDTIVLEYKTGKYISQEHDKTFIK